MEFMEHHCTVFHDTLFNKYAAIVGFVFRKQRLNNVTTVTVCLASGNQKVNR